MSNFNGHIVEDRLYMENILLEYLIKNFFKDKTINKNIINHKILQITYYNLLSGDKYYNVTCETTYKDVTHKSERCIYEKQLKLIERKHKIHKIQNSIKG